ncbi:ABC transporter substrate-binding protein [Salinibacterium hongtaonis]|uniref:ABC transporter substrate-binding protein n=1 Tax=Homoserinimonas hongtaonis TaxID=2079791 RepID=UPI000D357E6E|nr:ABC transporter substrate-binding protein [Salinibacterium hongtaonis]AWB90330.1 hypothetical protein C2138_12905 [Salinibacterium hongtaonis]
MKSLQHARQSGPSRRGIRWTTAVLASASLMLAGCAADTGPSESSTDGALIVGVTQDVGKFDPIYSNLPTYNQFAYATPVYQTAGGEYGPYLASSWEFAPDNTSIALTLRSDAKFSDGTEVDADAVANSMVRFLTTMSPKLQQYGTQIAGVTATADDTVEIAFKNPVPQSYALSLLNQDSAFAMITAPAATADPESIEATTNGAGPYQLDPEKSTSGTEYTYVPNPHYFAPETLTYDTVVIKPFSDPSALGSALTSGQVTYAVSLLAPLAGQAESAGMQMSKGALGIGESGTAMLVFGDRTEGPLADVRVRQAIAHAIPRDDLNSSLYAGFATPTSSATPVGLPGHTGEDPYAYDLDRAKQLLSEAGFPNGFDLVVTSPSAMDPGNLLGQAVQGALQALGINVTLERNDDPFTALMGKILTDGGFPAYIYNAGGANVFGHVTGSMSGVGPINPNGEPLPMSVTDALTAAVTAPADEQDELLVKVTEAIDEIQWSVTLISVPRLTAVQPGVKSVPASYLTPEPNPISPNKGESWSGN